MALRAILCLAAAFLAVPAEARTPRDRAHVRAFRAENPCPATGHTRGACPGFEVDHVQSLCSGGADKKENLQWLSKEDHRFKTLVDVRECRRARATQ